VPKWKKEIVEIVCVFEKDLPTSFMNLQVHLLMHLVDDIELADVIFTRWMFFFEIVCENSKNVCPTKGTSRGLHG